MENQEIENLETTVESNESIDLLQELSKATEVKPDISEEPMDIPVDSLQNEDDFMPAPEEPTDIPADPTEEINHTHESINLIKGGLADGIVSFVDFIYKDILPTVHENQIFTPEERVDLKTLLAELKHVKKSSNTSYMVEITNHERKLLGKYEDLDNYKEKAPLTTAEKKAFKESLIPVLKKWDYQPSPESALTMVAFTISLPRLAPIGLKWWENKQDNNKQDNKGGTVE